MNIARIFNRVATRRRTLVSFAGLLAGLSAAAGCALPTVEFPATAYDDALRRELTKAVADLYPDSLQAVHRVTLAIYGQDFPLTGYVLARRPGDIRLVAASELGGTFFDLALAEGKRASVLRNSSPLRPAWLLRGALRDAAAIYLARPGPDARLARYANGDFCLLDDLPDGVEREFRFTGDPRRLAEYCLLRGSKRLYRIRFSEQRTIGDWPHAFPTVMEIEDYELGYRASVQAVALRAAPAGITPGGERGETPVERQP